MTLLEQIKQSNFKYSPTVVRDLIDSNRAKYGYVKPVTKKIIFFMMKRIVLRGAITFFNINKNRSNDVYYELEDIANEIYMVLDKCADKFDTTQGKDFYLYFNSSVTRRISRIANYKRVKNDEVTFSRYNNMYSNEDGMEIEALIEDKFATALNSDTLLWDDIDSIGLDKGQRELLQCLYETEKTKDIVEETGLTRAEIKQQVAEIKQQFEENYL